MPFGEGLYKINDTLYYYYKLINYKLKTLAENVTDYISHT